MGCRHPEKTRTVLPGRQYHCGLCDQDVTRRAPRGIRHGTVSGYDKHRRECKGRWKWPLAPETCGCLEAHREYAREYLQREKPREQAALRGKARQRAFSRLQDLYPSDYAKLYAEEMSILQDGGTVLKANIEREIAAVLGRVSQSILRGRRGLEAEAVLRQVMLEGCMTEGERAAWRQVVLLRRRFEEIDAPPAKSRRRSQ